MLSKTHARPGNSPAPAVIPDTSTGPGTSDGNGAPAQTETRGGHFRRKAHRARLYGYAIATVALAAYLIALAASNTARVNVSWVFGSSHVSLVWLVLFAAILGWLLGLVTGARFHWRTRAPRRRQGASS
jgi:uncharacterized integral membrane protein